MTTAGCGGNGDGDDVQDATSDVAATDIAAGDVASDAAVDGGIDQGIEPDVVTDEVGGDVLVPAGLGSVPAKIDFVYSRTDDPRQRVVTVTNDGDVDLRVSGAAIVEASEPADEGLFFIVEDPAFPPDSGEGANPSHMLLAPGASHSFHVGYVKLGADNRQSTAGLVIQYRLPEDGPETARELRIPLTAAWTENQYCDIAIYDIGSVVFDMIPAGTSADKVFRFKNTGTGTCSITAFKLADCVVGDTIDCPDPFTGADSVDFQVASPDQVVGMLVPPGSQSEPITLHFPARDETLGTSYSAIMSFQASDDAGFLTNQPNCGGDTGVRCGDNVSAQTFAGPYIPADHPQFGKVRVGCAVTLKAYVMNDGPAAQLQNIQTGSCPATFSVAGIPATFPVNLGPHQQRTLDVTYTPAAVGQESCAITWTIDGKDIVGTATGEGTEDFQVTDTFVVAEGDVSFDLSGVPGGPIDVTIDGVPCNEGWTIAFPDYNPRAVPSGSCIPETGDTVNITYSVSCVS